MRLLLLFQLPKVITHVDLWSDIRSKLDNVKDIAVAIENRIVGWLESKFGGRLLQFVKIRQFGIHPSTDLSKTFCSLRSCGRSLHRTCCDVVP